MVSTTINYFVLFIKLSISIVLIILFFMLFPAILIHQSFNSSNLFMIAGLYFAVSLIVYRLAKSIIRDTVIIKLAEDNIRIVFPFKFSSSQFDKKRVIGFKDTTRKTGKIIENGIVIFIKDHKEVLLYEFAIWDLKKVRILLRQFDIEYLGIEYLTR